jgi:lysophospholipase L1-like esterase
LAPTLSELRIGWTLLALLTAAALLPASPGLVVGVVWLLALLPGSVVLAHPRAATRAAEALRGGLTGRMSWLRVALTAGLLTFAAMVYSVSAALLLATALLSAMLVAASRGGADRARAVLEHALPLAAALVLVLVPLEFVLRIPSVARQFGQPVERARQEESYDRLWERNVFHFRSRHEQVGRRPGVRRVIALGDSFTWGLLLPSSDSAWPARLERALDGGDAGPAEVINMGQRGWGTANEAEFLRRLGWQFEPDLVIVQFFLNDAYESGPDFRFQEGRRVVLLPDAFAQGYIRSSALAALVARGVNGLLFGILFPESEGADLYAEDAPGWRQMRSAIREIGDSARSRNRPVLFVLFPALLPGEWTPETYPAREVYRRVARQAAESGLTVLDLTEAFAAQGGDWQRWWATPYDSHPNAQAHAVAAAAIAAHIREHGLLVLNPGP